MDFGLLPPEVNSGRMYAGPGPGPMLVATAAWDSLAAELHTMAAVYESSIAELDSRWQGPSSMAMATAATRYTEWLHATAAQAERTAAQGRTAAAAYEAAFAATVPPPLIEANRSLLMSLIATNFLGQNTAAIAATEAHYAEMWAQDATAMYAYAGSTATATQLAPFGQPPPTASPAASADQPAATARATAASAGSTTQLPKLMTLVSNALHNLNSTPLPQPALAAGIHDGMAGFNSLFGDLFGPYSVLGYAGLGGGWFLTASNILTVSQNVSPIATLLGAPKPVTGALAPLFGQLTSAPLGPGGAGVSGAIGRAGLIGRLSVPPAWATVAPAPAPAATTLTTATSAIGVAPAITGGTHLLLGAGLGLSGLAGRAMAVSATQSAAAGARTIATTVNCVGSTATAGSQVIDNTVTILVIPPPE